MKITLFLLLCPFVLSAQTDIIKFRHGAMEVYASTEIERIFLGTKTFIISSEELKIEEYSQEIKDFLTDDFKKPNGWINVNSKNMLIYFENENCTAVFKKKGNNISSQIKCNEL